MKSTTTITSNQAAFVGISAGLAFLIGLLIGAKPLANNEVFLLIFLGITLLATTGILLLLDTKKSL